MTNEIEHHFICLLAIQISSFVMSVTHFSTGCPYFSLLFVAFFRNAYILNICIANAFFPLCGLTISPFSDDFHKQKFLILVWSNISGFTWWWILFSKKCLPIPRSGKCNLNVLPLKALLFCLSHSDLQSIWNLLIVWCEVGATYISFPYRYSIDHPFWQHCSVEFAINQIKVYIWVCSWTFFSSVGQFVSSWFQHHSCNFHSFSLSTPVLLPFFKIALCVLGILHFQINFVIILSSCACTQKFLLRFRMILHYFKNQFGDNWCLNNIEFSSP